MALTLYTIHGSSRCSNVRRWLTRFNIPFTERCLDTDALASMDIGNILHSLHPDPPLFISPNGLVATYEQLERAVEHDTLLDLIMAESMLEIPDCLSLGIPSDLFPSSTREWNGNEWRGELSKHEREGEERETLPPSIQAVSNNSLPPLITRQLETSRLPLFLPLLSYSILFCESSFRPFPHSNTTFSCKPSLLLPLPSIHRSSFSSLLHPSSLSASFDSCESSSISSIPDDLLRLIHHIKSSSLIKDNRVGLIRLYTNSFKGDHFIHWCMTEKDMTRKEAIEMGQDLIERNVVQQSSKENGETFSPDRYYQLVEDDENKPLNSGEPSLSHTVTVTELNEQLVRIIQPIYDNICAGRGNIAYYRLTETDDLLRYMMKCKQLQTVNLRDSSPDERLALFINLYNMLVIHITHKYGPPTSVWQRRKFVNTTYYTIDGHSYALQSILNGILRSNRRGRDMLWKPFGDQDQRLPLIMPVMDASIHFAISTAERGAGPLRAYSVHDIRGQLKDQVSRLIGKEEWLKIESKKKTIYISKLFKWYAEDFGTSNVKILEWIINHMEDPEDSDKKKELKRIYLTGDYKIDYLNYDSSFNGVERCERPTLIPDLEYRLRTTSEPIEYSFSIPPTPTC
uniref:DEP domain-containing protein n=1 Tax=Pristionchus pacificus TaxID=54126 RepID=A0A8R1URQ4_PRIPA